MELNGIANIKLLIEFAKEDNKIDTETYSRIKEQLELLTDYMKQLQVVKGKQWHEIREEYYARN